MKRVVLTVGKVAFSLLIAGAVAFLSTDNELPMSVVTLALVLAGAFIFVFASGAARLVALFFLPTVVAVQHGMDRYFWYGVHEQGAWWPWQYASAGVITSIARQAGDIADAASVVLLALAIAFATLWRLLERKWRVA